MTVQWGQQLAGPGCSHSAVYGRGAKLSMNKGHGRIFFGNERASSFYPESVPNPSFISPLSLPPPPMRDPPPIDPQPISPSDPPPSSPVVLSRRPIDPPPNHTVHRCTAVVVEAGVLVLAAVMDGASRCGLAVAGSVKGVAGSARLFLFPFSIYRETPCLGLSQYLSFCRQLRTRAWTRGGALHGCWSGINRRGLARRWRRL